MQTNYITLLNMATIEKQSNLKVTNLLYLKYLRCLIGVVGRLFTNVLGDLGSIPGRVIPKTLKMVLDISLLNIQQYKVRKMELSRERSRALPYILV